MKHWNYAKTKKSRYIYYSQYLFNIDGFSKSFMQLVLIQISPLTLQMSFFHFHWLLTLTEKQYRNRTELNYEPLNYS